MPRLRTLSALLATAALVAACDDPFDDGARQDNVDVALEVWAITGGPAAFPTALVVPFYTVVPVDAPGSFDIAFDIDADGRLRVLPMNKVVSPLLGPRNVGLLRSGENYSTIIEAPRTGWLYDSTLTVNPGGAFLVRVQTRYCDGELRQDVYAKFYVDSVLPLERRVKLFARINPNCGFRSFADGLPEY
jgi:hypothetical protein